MKKARNRLSAVFFVLVYVIALTVNVFAAQPDPPKTKYTNDFSKGTTEYNLFDLRLEIPDAWEYFLNEDKGRHEFHIYQDDFLFVQMFPANMVSEDEPSILNSHMEDIVFSGYTTEWIWTEEYKSDHFRGMVTDAVLDSGSIEYNAACFTYYGTANIYHIGIINRPEFRHDYNRDLVKIIEYGTFPESLTRDLPESTDIHQMEARAPQLPVQQAQQSQPAESDYVVNINSGKFHYPNCRSVGQMKASNRWDYHGSREWLISNGYDPCKNCNP